MDACDACGARVCARCLSRNKRGWLPRACGCGVAYPPEKYEDTVFGLGDAIRLLERVSSETRIPATFTAPHAHGEAHELGLLYDRRAGTAGDLLRLLKKCNLRTFKTGAGRSLTMTGEAVVVVKARFVADGVKLTRSLLRRLVASHPCMP